ncbi:MAG: CoA-binding protein [Chloroflexota bacterium]|nr:CoA-binding protein [Chloroflexota bacterium]MDE3192128.1 CoA-binding protein [Chloroflexota bacterium]
MRGSCHGNKTSHRTVDVGALNEVGLADRLLSSARTIALVGYSDKPHRPASSVAAYLRSQGFRVIPVNPRLRGRVVDGELSYERLTDIPRDVRIDLVDVFRRGEFLDDVVDDAIAAKAPAIWFQLSLGNVAAAERAERAGLQVVWDRCTAIEHRRLRAERTDPNAMEGASCPIELRQP